MVVVVQRRSWCRTVFVQHDGLPVPLMKQDEMEGEEKKADSYVWQRWRKPLRAPFCQDREERDARVVSKFCGQDAEEGRRGGGGKGG